MEKGRGSRIIAIVALCVAVAGLSLGFAAFSSNLVIKSSADVKPDKGDFKVAFSNAAAGQPEGGATVDVTPTITEVERTNSEGENESVSTIGDLTATFTKPGQKVTYTFDITNKGKYPAYLNSVTFANATGAEEFRVCTPGAGTTAAYVEGTCGSIELTLTIGNREFSNTVENISGITLGVGQSTTATVVIEYTDAPVLADGDFSVAFGDIELEYGSVD